MFTGIIEHLGIVRQIRRQPASAAIVIEIGGLSDGVSPGDSVAINGACLTVTNIKGADTSFDVSTETLNKTTIGKLKISERVNVERSLKIGDRLGGHFVTGHVDGIGAIIKKEMEVGQCTIRFSTSEELANMMIKKGSVSVDGISLTIVEIGEKTFSTAIIPYTLKETTLGFKKTGDQVNLETDMLGKWVKRILKTEEKHTSRITEKVLRQNGFL